MTLPELSAALQNMRWPQVPERRPTFFSIARIAHYENIMSNVYQFFFNTESPHGLGSLCIDALGDVIEAKQPDRLWPMHSFRRAFTRREERTDNDKRLDLLIHNGPKENDWWQASNVILIENKVHHWLANDLNEYWQYTEQENAASHKVGIVLGLKSENIPEHWRNNWLAITHLEWAQAAENRIGPLVYRAEPRYLTLLLELIENIKTMTAQREDFRELCGFYMQNREAIMRIVTIRQQILSTIPSEVARMLPEGYKMGYQDESVDDFWFVVKIDIPSAQAHYVIWYGKVFSSDYEKSNPSYIIDLTSDDEQTALVLRETLKSVATEAGVEISNRPRYVMGREYSVSQYDGHLLPKLITDSLRNDWQPLEKYWLK